MPDIQNAKQYAEYVAAVKEFIELEQLTFLSTSCDEDGTPEDEGGNIDPWFSWSPCEMCGSHLGGDREYLRARALDDEIVTFEICEDCVYFVNYGRLDDETMMRVDVAKERS